MKQSSTPLLSIIPPVGRHGLPIARQALPRRVTLKSIAMAGKVSTMTVSYALRNHPRVSKETRERIQALARKLGYRPDPNLSKLMSYLSNRRKIAYVGTLAYVNIHADEHYLEYAPASRIFFDAAQARATHLGYRVEVFWSHAPGMTPKRLSAILFNRGIQGVIVGSSQQAGSSLDLEWDRFSGIALGHTLAQPNLHRVVTNHFHNMRLAIRKVVERGYARIGIVDVSHIDKFTDHGALAGYLCYQKEISQEQRIPPLIISSSDGDAIRTWLENYQPDAVIGFQGTLHKKTQDMGLIFPRDLGFATLANYFRDPLMAGVDPNFEDLGTTAADMVIGQIMRNDLGLPDNPHLIQVDGNWIEGKTLGWARPRLRQRSCTV